MKPLATDSAPMTLLDTLGRPLRDLRISVMDRCNFRCPYCMPESKYGEHFRFLGNDERLSYAEIHRIAKLAAELGVRKLRITGGEPLLRPDLADLVSLLRTIPGIADIALTTNGVLLPRQAERLKQAGLDRVTISLDSLDAAVFTHMSGGKGNVEAVLTGIAAAEAAGFGGGIKINMVVQRGVNEADVLAMAGHFRGTGHVVRFIEFMDVGNRNAWQASGVVPSAELIRRIDDRWPLQAVEPVDRSAVATRWRYQDGAGEIGFISSVSAPFCGGCTRARLSSDGKLYTCLFAQAGIDLLKPLRQPISDQALLQLIGGRWRERGDRYSEVRGLQSREPSGSTRKIEMHYIGG